MTFLDKPFTMDLNCDMGESFGNYLLGNDEDMMPLITSANIACGFHAGDPGVMKRTVRMALRHGVAIGAHPGLPDLQGFGRREMAVSPEEVYDMVVYQIGALAAFVKSEGGNLHHVKPHGALYNMAATNKALATAIAEAIYKLDQGLIVYGLSSSELISAAQRIGLPVANEVFADRTYQEDGTLTPRNKDGALITNTEDSVNQVLNMIKQGKVNTLNGTAIPIQADTICLHGDGKHALTFAAHISGALTGEGIQLQPFTPKP